MSDEREKAVKAHTEEMVVGAMGYVFAKLAEDPSWLMRMDRTGSLADAVRPDAAEFMKHRGNFASANVAADVLAHDAEVRDAALRELALVFRQIVFVSREDERMRIKVAEFIESYALTGATQ